MATSPDLQQSSKTVVFTSSNLATVIAIAVVAYAADDTVHELLGHGITALFLHVKVLAVSTVGLQTAESSRMVAAAGAIANVIAGAIGLLFVRRSHGSASWRYFLWLFGFLNLMNGTGYLMASALLNSGDWAVVISGLQPPLLWRAGMGALGIISFITIVRWSARVMASMVNEGLFDRRDMIRLTVPPYFAGGVLFIAASVFNPVGSALILGSGAGASLGLTFGLLLAPGMIKDMTKSEAAHQQEAKPPSLPLSKSWIVAALLMAAIFIGIFGPGVRL